MCRTVGHFTISRRGFWPCPALGQCPHASTHPSLGPCTDLGPHLTSRADVLGPVLSIQLTCSRQLLESGAPSAFWPLAHKPPWLYEHLFGGPRGPFQAPAVLSLHRENLALGGQVDVPQLPTTVRGQSAHHNVSYKKNQLRTKKFEQESVLES